MITKLIISSCGLDLTHDRRSRIAASFTSRRWCWEIHRVSSAEGTCEAELYARLPHLQRESWPDRFVLGGIYVAGRTAQPDMQLNPPCRLEYYEPLCDLSQVSSLYPAFDPTSIIYCDDDIGIVCKPPGLPSTAPRDQVRFNVMRYLSDYLRRDVHLPSRLDVGVGGVMIFSLTQRMNRFLQRAYDRRSIERYYVAEVRGRPTWDRCDVRWHIARDPRHAVLRRPVLEGGEDAHTTMTLLSSHIESGGEMRSLVQAEPQTGRTHQIRVHCLTEGLPIIGDPFYWDLACGSFDVGGIRLSSYAVRFFHPYRREWLTFEVPNVHKPAWLRDYQGKERELVVRYREGGEL